ncbi:MAG: DUF2484 family protein [Pelagimonas sp.]|jgi:membrane-associated phospholipid phosphatase|nr:DUF2484 family protein [Pelagimonas sp.]
MTISMMLACAWLLLANLAGSFPSKDNHWSRAYVLMSLGTPLMIWVFWENGPWLGLLVLAAALSVFRWPAIYAWRRVRARFGAASDKSPRA